MTHILRALPYLLIPILVSTVYAYLRKPRKAEGGKVHLPGFIAVLGIITAVIFLIPAILTIYSEESLWLSVLFFLFSLLGIVLVLMFLNCRISYDEDNFSAGNLFGRERTFPYDRVTAIKETADGIYIYMGQQRISIEAFAVGQQDFVQLVKKKYRTLHNGEHLPAFRPAKRDIFNGHIDNAGGILFAYVLVTVVMIGLFSFAIYHTYFTTENTSSTTEQTISFLSCDRKADEMIMTSTDHRIYKIRHMDADFNAEAIRLLCDGETQITVYSDEVNSDDDGTYHSVKALLYNGSYVLSFEETNRFHRQANTPFVVLSAGFCLLWGGFVAASLVIGRNPHKFSKRVVGLFFQERCVRY